MFAPTSPLPHASTSLLPFRKRRPTSSARDGNADATTVPSGAESFHVPFRIDGEVVFGHAQKKAKQRVSRLSRASASTAAVGSSKEVWRVKRARPSMAES